MTRRLLVSLFTALCLAQATPALAQNGPPPGEWQEIVPSGPVYGPDGTPYAPSCSAFPGYGDPTFRFFARMGTLDKTVVYFEGGGACWDGGTCSFPFLPEKFPQPRPPELFVPVIPPGYSPANIGGLFRADRADNPVRDWNIVYIPYCTGDIHTGSADRTYTSAGNAALGLPPGARLTIRHRGFDNFMAVLDWLKRQPAPDQILVTGVSAGGYGATANFPWIRETFKDARVSLLADASQGITTATFDTGMPGRESWNPQLAPWVFGDPPSTLPGPQLMRAVAQAYPRSKVAQFTTTLDAVQIAFYGVQKGQALQQGQVSGVCPLNPADPLNPVSVAADWNQQMLAALTSDAADLGNYRYYLAAGQYHTLLRDENYYNEKTRGVPFAAWLGQMLKNQGGTNGVGGKWFNIACPTCLTPLPCP